MYSKLIQNAIIIDGSGKPPFRGDVAFNDDTIVRIGDLSKYDAEEIIDVHGSFLTPGFIDIQNHSDVYWTIFDNPKSDSLVMQGITTALIGNCGASLAPLLSRDALLSIQKWHTLQGVNFNWLSFTEYLDELSTRNFGVNIASLVGYSTLRRGIVKNDIRNLSEAEEQTILQELERSIAAGAFGLSSGLSYAHEASIGDSELLAAAKIVKKYNGLFSVHLRSEAATISESVNEAISLMRSSDVRVKISHLKIRDKENWRYLPDILEQLEQAYQEHQKIHFDIYPYDFVWQVIYPYLPQWATVGGREALIAHLQDQTQRKKILDYLQTKDINYSQLLITSTSMPLNVIGKTIGEVAKRQNVSSEEAMLTIIEHGGSEVLVFDQNLDQEQVEEMLKHPLAIVATDGAGFSKDMTDRLVHPRCFGSMLKFLSDVFQKKLLPIEEAIQKITSTPASVIGLHKRGKIAEGFYADLVVFTDGITSHARYHNPMQYPTGISHVFVNGKQAMVDGVLSDSMYGTVLKRK